jgi:hypothetical protein
MDFWKPGDRVFLFGFSRGAYTVRVLAGLLHALGLLPRGNRQLVPYVIRLFQALRREGPPENADASSAWSLGREFRWTLARHQPGGDDERRFRVHFLGLWDTVSSVGWAWDPLKFPYTARNPSVDVVRHAVSLDERRWFFRQNSMQPAPQQDFQELWFPGVHGDVGGDYPENEGGLWRVAFEWLLAEAEKFGLRVNGRRLKTVLDRSRPPERPWAEPQHDSLTGLWWPAEFFPKLAGRPDGSRRLPRVGLGRHRVVPQHALIHQSTLLRIRDSSLAYAPPNLSPRFLDRVRRLPNVPPWLPFER